MITIISGTNRADNYSIKFAKIYSEILDKKGVENQILDLRELPKDFLFTETYGNRTEGYEQLLTKYVYQSDKWMIVSPEYNGTFSGVLKSFIDSLEPKRIVGIKTAMIGLAAGRAGNLRGMDHMTNCLHYLQMPVMPNKLPISQVFKLMDGDKLVDNDTLELLNSHAEQLINF